MTITTVSDSEPHFVVEKIAEEAIASIRAGYTIRPSFVVSF
jgi:hypothetical protein